MAGLGLDLGYSSVKAVIVDGSDLIWSGYVMHKGKVFRCLSDMLESVLERFRPDYIETGGITGSGGARISRSGLIGRVLDVSALVEGGLKLVPEARSIIEIGGQVSRYISGVGGSGHVEVSMNSGCASGTGSFLEEQMSRLSMSIEDFGSMASRATSIPRIAARCSVFAKSDIIHHQQEGVPVEDILMGLAYGVAGSYKGGVVKGNLCPGPVLFCGGVSRNEAMVKALEKTLNLESGRLRIHGLSSVAGAIGSAIVGVTEGMSLDLLKLKSWVDDQCCGSFLAEEDSIPLPSLAHYGTGDGEGKHNCSTKVEASSSCWIGIDVGSTSTDLVALDKEGRVLAYRYLRTSGNPAAAVSTGLTELSRLLRSPSVLGVGVTGSGRGMIGRLVGADRVKDEITAQARGAVAMDPEVDTIFEIGGQDSKYISLENGSVVDFQMNKVCAAGTGAFLEEQASKLGIPLDEFGGIALNGEHPANLGERCTVFMESSVASHLAAGIGVDDIASGLCHSIVKNYLNRVVGNGKIGKKIFLQGGIAHNQGVVNAFRANLSVPIVVPPFFSVTGAIGAALLARDEMTPGESSSFGGFGLSKAEATVIESSPQPEIRGGMDRFTAQVHRDLLGEVECIMDPSRPTVGIPRALFCYGMYPMFAPFFRTLGLNVLLSEPSSEETVRLAQEYSLDETCYPLKLINGHVAELVAKKVDFVFFPDLHSVFHPQARSRQCYGCPYMQLAFKMVDRAMDLSGRGIGLLAPTIAFNLGKEFVMKSFLSMGTQIGASEEESMRALKMAMMSQEAFSEELEHRALATMAGLDKSSKTFVILSKVYGIADPLLNMGVPGMLEDMGYKALPFYSVPSDDIFDEHPNMYWPFGQHVLSAARQVAVNDNLHGVFLSHHGCGPDTVTSHYLKETLGEKPFLSVEVDEHSSSIGVRTRVEAFVNSVGRFCRGRQFIPVSRKLLGGAPLWVPPLRPYSSIASALASFRGVEVLDEPPLSISDIDRGRRHALSGEYLSLSAIMGRLMNDGDRNGVSIKAIIPQNEGAEVDGQIGRWVEAVFSCNDISSITVETPFMEDLPLMDETVFRDAVMCLLAGDLVMASPLKSRNEMCSRLCEIARRSGLSMEIIGEAARSVPARSSGDMRKILVVGEPLILFSPGLNCSLFEDLEATVDIRYAPMSEALWMFWNDLWLQPTRKEREKLKESVDFLKKGIAFLSSSLAGAGHFDEDLDELSLLADSHLGHYSGAFGRYRGAKAIRARGMDGVISVASMYENTGISLGILGYNPSVDGNYGGCPNLSLVFDGTATDDNRVKVESFLHYLQPCRC